MQAILRILLTAGLGLLLTAEIVAQGRTSGSSLGAGQSSFGPGLGGPGLGGSGLGGSGLGGSGLGTSGTGGMGGSPFGSRTTGAMGAGNFGAGASARGLGGGNETASTFVGRTSEDLSQIFAGAAASARANQRRTQQNTGRQAARGAAPSQRPAVRVRLNVAFDYRTPAPQAVVAAVQGRLQRQPNLTRLGNIDATFAEGIATLRGSVADDSRRLVAEKLVLLEPGVREVKNEIEVVKSAPETLPGP